MGRHLALNSAPRHMLDSIEELRGEIADAIGLQLNEAMRLGFLDEYIEERNVRTLL